LTALKSPADRIEFVLRLLRGPLLEPIDPDDENEPPRYGPGLITEEQAVQLLTMPMENE